MNTHRNMDSNFTSVSHDNTYISQKLLSISIIENQDLFETMKNERNRLNSFNDKWPLDFISINDLVKCGFFYLLSDDKVQCAFCQLILAKWEIDDEPLDQHKKFSPKCCFLPNSEKTDHFKKTLDISNFNYIYTPLFNSSKPQRAKVPRMSDVRKRLSTFKGWSVTMISVEDLAVCGLFYTGIDDVVTCFSCGISFGDWEPSDEPMTKHSKFYSNCIFLHFIISGSCLERRKTRKPLNVFPESISKRSPSSAEVLKSEIVLRAKEIFPSHLVEEVLCKHLKETGEVFTSLQHLCDKVLEYEEKKLKIRLSATQKESDQCSILYTPGVSTKAGYDMKSTKDVLLCKVCFTEERMITFQPCGHLISCDLCSQQISKCPICRLPVQKRIKTYLS